MSDYYQVIATVDTKENAEIIAEAAVKARAAACCQISGPIKSVYWWKENIDRTEEYYCIFKTTKSKYYELEKIIKENHKYQIPEIIALKIEKGYKDYIDWLKAETM